MNLNDELAGVLARDARYPIQAYIFLFESLEFTKARKKRSLAKGRARRGKPGDASRHVTGPELCEGVRDLALKQYGLLAMAVLGQWGIHNTSDLGNIVFNLIESGDLEKTDRDSRDDFDDVFEFEAALRRDYIVALDDVA